MDFILPVIYKGNSLKLITYLKNKHKHYGFRSLLYICFMRTWLVYFPYICCFFFFLFSGLRMNNTNWMYWIFRFILLLEIQSKNKTPISLTHKATTWPQWENVWIIYNFQTKMTSIAHITIWIIKEHSFKIVSWLFTQV